MSESVILRVIEGLRPMDNKSRTFTVFTSEPVEDLSIIASAVDPKTGVPIPSEQDVHPDDPSLVARPPWIYPIYSRMKGGARLPVKPRMFNVVSKFILKEVSRGGE